MTTIFMEPGTSATYDSKFYTSTTGIVSSGSAAPLPPESVRYNQCGPKGWPAAPCYYRKNSILGDAGRRISFYIYLPSGIIGNFDYFRIQSGDLGSSFVFLVHFPRKSGDAIGYVHPELFYDDVGNSIVGSYSSIAADSWTRICLAYTITSTTVNEFRLWAGNNLVLTASNITLSRTGTSDLLIGNVFGALSDIQKVMFAHLYVDDSSSLQNLGDIRVGTKLPAAINNNNFDTTLGNGAVNERPVSTTNGKRHNANSQVNQDYTIQATDVGDYDLTGIGIVARCAWLWGTRTGSGGAGSPAIIDQGLATAITLVDDTPTLYTIIMDTKDYPSNAAGIGMRSTGSAKDTLFYECGVLIAYRPVLLPIASITPSGMIQHTNSLILHATL